MIWRPLSHFFENKTDKIRCLCVFLKMSRQLLLGKSRAKRMLSMVEGGITLSNHGDVDNTKEVTKAVEDENVSGNCSPSLQCLSPSFDLQPQLLRSPSNISYESAIFENVDFVASPNSIFTTPRQRKRRFKDNLGSRSKELYGVFESSDNTTLSEMLVAETSDKNTFQEENLSYTILDTVCQDLQINALIPYSTPVDISSANVLILQNKHFEFNNCNNTLTTDSGILTEISTARIDLGVESNNCNNITTSLEYLSQKNDQSKENINVLNSCNDTVADDINQDLIIQKESMVTENVPLASDILPFESQSSKTAIVPSVSTILPPQSQSVTSETVPTVPERLQLQKQSAMIDDENNLSVSDLPQTAKELTRKRKRHVKDWEKVKNKKLKNSGQEYKGCCSKKKFDSKKMGDVCKCKKKCGDKIPEEKRQAIFNAFWKLGDHEEQWHYILRHVNINEIKKMQLVRSKNRTQTIKYNFKDRSETIDVCKKFFLNTLSITELTVYTAIEKGKCDEVKDNRGHHDNRPRKMSVSTEQSIIAHIKLFPVKESHYVRKDTKRLYLEETLNISKMYRLYVEWFEKENDSNDIKMATKRQYETIFNTKFNYSFHKPKKDVCGQCTLYDQADDERKEQLKESYTRHIKNKECVRELKAKDKAEGNPTDTVVAIYDLEKVLTIPQSEVGIFHYKRKYPIYNFTIYNSLNEKGYCYLWHYQLAKRGANEIGSCLLNFIESETDKGIKNFIFYSDGCAGQNKNRIIFALYLHMAKKYGVNIIHRYFETGHSQSEGDMMHSLIERAKKNHTIFTPDQMYGIIMNAKINGEKFQLMEMEQHNFYDLKEMMAKRYWLRADQTNEKVMWSKVHEIKITADCPDVIYFKYNFDDDYNSLNTVPASRSSRGRCKRTPATDVSANELSNLYREPIALPKPLYDDLLSLCKIEAIPKHYHLFYNNLMCVGDTVEELDIEREDSD